MLKLDPAILDQDTIHKNKRKFWLKIIIVPVIILLILSLLFIRPTIYNMALSASEKSAEYGTTEALTNLQLVGNFIEPYVPYYNRGLATLLKAEDKEALESSAYDFRESLKHNPPESTLCSIYGNLSYSIELEADLEVNAKNYNDALVYYNQAESILYENGCASEKEGSKGSDEKSETAKERIIEKRRKTVNQANSDSSEDDSLDKNDTIQEITDETLKKIKEYDVKAIPGGTQQFQRGLRRVTSRSYGVPGI